MIREMNEDERKRFERARAWLESNLSSTAETTVKVPDQPAVEEPKSVRKEHHGPTNRRKSVQSDMLTLADVAKELNVSYESARKLAISGKIPVIKVGEVYRVPKKTFAEWMQAQLKSFSHDTHNPTTEGETA